MLFSDALRREVVSTATATRVGRVEGFVLAAGPARVAMLRLGKVTGDGSLLDWENVQGFGTDAATVADVDAIRSPRDEWESHLDSKASDVVGKRVLSERGDELGTVADVDFDPETGTVVTFITDRETIGGDRLIGNGSYAVVVSVDRQGRHASG